jgi:allantoate deiminase
MMDNDGIPPRRLAMTAPALGLRLMEKLDALALHTDEPGRLTRLYLSPAHKSGADALSQWMRAAGMQVRIDPLATVIGRYEGSAPDAPAILIGSHIDTVRDAGKYDGAFGVLAGLIVVEELARNSERLPFAIEVLAFGDEEGVRFPSTLSGSRAIAGSFETAALSLKDENGVSLADALAAFGCAPDRTGEAAMAPGSVLAYVEAHIEQGPVLEAMDRPLGVVTAINGACRLLVSLTGEAGHSGTVPMPMRKDALAAAAEMVLAVERAGRAHEGLVATVGRIEARPGAVNVIPGETIFTVDVRAASDGLRDECVAAIRGAIEEIAARRGIRASIELTHQAPATPCSPQIIAALSQAVFRAGASPVALLSGAGHDAMAIAPLCPIGMLFVRCKGGISHNPAESITAEDADACARALLEFLRHFAPATH